MASEETLPPRFKGLRPASERSSRAARAASQKRDTACELTLRRALWRLGLRYRVDVCDLPGRPDVVFSSAKVVVFCDGDFWHGRDLEARVARLAIGHNAVYWVAKVRANVMRDKRNSCELEANGWVVVRLWESDIHRRADEIAHQIAELVASRRR